ncbi:autotransporter-associated beta strand repeat-containing protein [Telmatocola sphagniphila]|uniref:Autotransporter-associated beta strand repeat-containing protein n=1 Tax=Telmatocola sphagniphila TaxID=1123043 RepID=A0A8E6B658_9BACT|nr:autotransporter-associated beta strand repeat-containing protein [Telmatocola sphagniphila]QVL31881.1 autotransporter-associated beta strand repeat-containing protein [Telmatocola sphagniphila]
MKFELSRKRSLASLAILLGLSQSTQAATYTWNNLGTDWTSGTSWSPAGGPPSTADLALFSINSSSYGSTVSDPQLNSATAVLSVTFAPNQNLGGWNFSGSGTLTVGGTASTGISTYGPATYNLNGPALSGSSATSLLNLNVYTSSTLVFKGTSTATTNLGNIVVGGGYLQVDNSVNNIARFGSATSNLVTVTGGGTFELIGNSSGTTFNVGSLSAGANTIGGVNSFKVTPNGAATTLVFANSAAGFTTRPGTRGIYEFIATTGNLGDVNGARITFAGTPFLGANGLLSNTSGGGTFGYAIVTDAGGTDFATWNATNGIVRATPTQTASDPSKLQTYAATDRVQFNPDGTGSNPSATITNGSLRITPAAAGLTLTLGASNLATNALMLDGATDYAISANSTALFGGSGTRYIYVNNPNTTLTISGLQVANAGNPTSFGGPGFVVLSGSTSQNTLTTTNRFVIAGGTVRANNAQVGFTSSGNGVISLTGGVLEIQNGSNGTGSSADFTRGLGAAAGNVTWGAGTTNEVGSGGFSAFGSNASVNIGGNATPSTLQWNSTNFVGDGYALIFGSTKSNAVLTFLNPIQLDNGSAIPYQLREIRVIGGAGGDSTVLAGAITGASNADLLKTGSGTLNLSAANSYSGNTLINQGTLVVSGSYTGTGKAIVSSGATLQISGNYTVSSAINGTGNTVVTSGGTLSGTGTVSSALTLQRGGTLAPSTTGKLTTGNVVMAGGSTFVLNYNNGATNPNPGVDNNVIVGSTGAVLDLTGISTSNKLNLQINAFTTGSSNGTTQVYTFAQYSSITGLTAGDVTSLFNITGQYAGTPLVQYIHASSDALQVAFIPVPEPAHVLLMGCALVGILVWRRKRKVVSATVC